MMADGRTVLLVEDEPSTAEVLAFALEMEGYRVVTASNGREALQSLEQLTPDVVVSDVMMPLMDGRELCRAIQADDALRSVPVVLMSAAHDIETAGCAAVDFLRKPVDLRRLLDTVRRVTGEGQPTG